MFTKKRMVMAMMSNCTKVIAASLAENGKTWRDLAEWFGVAPSAISVKKKNNNWTVGEVKFIAKKFHWTDSQKAKCLS